MYCKGCRERMVGDGTWTEAHAKRQNELRSAKNEKYRANYARMPVEEKAALLARQQTYKRVFNARNREARNAAQKKYIQNIKLDPVKWEAHKQYHAEYKRKWQAKAEREKKRKRTLTDVNDDDDGDDSDAPPALAQIAIPGDNVVVISDDEDAGSVADTSGSSVEGIEFVYSDEE